MSKWISVRDKLPEPFVNVVVFSKSQGVGMDYYDGKYWGFDDVTHWMPLPEPPEEREENK